MRGKIRIFFDWVVDSPFFKWVAISVAIVLIVVGCFFIDWVGTPEIVHAEGPPVQTEIWGEGRIEGISEDIYLGFLSTGRVQEVKVQDGSKVKAGDPLVVLDYTQEQNNIDLAKNTQRLYKSQLVTLINGAHKYERAEAKAKSDAKMAEVEYARTHYERSLAIYRKDGEFIAKDEVEGDRARLNASIHEYNMLKANYDLLEAPAREDKIEEIKSQIAIAESEIKMAQEELERMTLRAPIDGEVLSVDIELGEFVSPQEPVLVMADTSEYRVRGYIEEYDCLSIKEGMSVEMKADSSDAVFKGVVRSLGSRMTTKEIVTNSPTEVMDTKMREVWIDLSDYNCDKMVVGLRVDVVISLGEDVIVSTDRGRESFYSDHSKR